MATESQIAANRRNAENSTGPRTEEGKQRSAGNAAIFGLYSASDFVCPDEAHAYELFCHSFKKDLRPQGSLEQTLAAEIIHAAWRLRRCATAESEMDSAGEDPILTGTQARIDRARAEAQRQLLRATNELRRLQTERQIRAECLPENSNVHAIGGLASIKSAQRGARTSVVRERAKDLKRFLQQIDTREPESLADPEPLTAPTKRTQSEAAEPHPTPRNAPCPCGSGDKYKRCCGRHAPPVLQQAA